MLPLGCFPLLGREGVILQTVTMNKRIKKKRISTELYSFKKIDHLPALIMTGTEGKIYHPD